MCTWMRHNVPFAGDEHGWLGPNEVLSYLRIQVKRVSGQRPVSGKEILEILSSRV